MIKDEIFMATFYIIKAISINRNVVVDSLW